MKTKKLIERLEQIMLDLPMEAMRQSRELDELIEELKDDNKRYVIKNGDEYWAFLGWTKSKTLASKYSREGAERIIENVLEKGELEEVE